MAERADHLHRVACRSHTCWRPRRRRARLVAGVFRPSRHWQTAHHRAAFIAFDAFVSFIAYSRLNAFEKAPAPLGTPKERLNRETRTEKEMATSTTERLRGELQPVLNDHEAALTKAAQRCLMTALDHSRAKAIVLMDESGELKGAPVLELPPQALRLVAQVLGALGDHRAITVVPRTLELTTTDAANHLNVSRPFLIKQLEAGHLAFRKVGTHRRIAYADLAAYKEQMKAGQTAALQELTDDAQELGLE